MRLTLLGTGFMEIRGGQVVKARNHWDFLSLLEAMDLLPERSFELAISGALSPHPQVTTKASVTKKTAEKRTKKKRSRRKATA